MILHPTGIVLEGRIETGYEVWVDDGQVQLRASNKTPDDFVLSPAFVNAHSHLEYRGFLGKISSTSYWPWIRELTVLKQSQRNETVRDDCFLAARENRQTGVGFIAEHSDRPFAAEALQSVPLDGIIFQEVITLLEHQDPDKKWVQLTEKAKRQQSQFSGTVRLSPHSPYTVDPRTLSRWRDATTDHLPFASIHVAETEHEREFFERNEGPIADLYAMLGAPRPTSQMPLFDYLDAQGLLRKGVQFVHACDVSDLELDRLAGAGVSIAHCPRSNQALGCPPAPIRRMIQRRIPVGIGLDSAASSGPIDFFAELQAVIATSLHNPQPITPSEAWQLATTQGAKSLGIGQWEIADGGHLPMIGIWLNGREPSFETLISSTPADVFWPVSAGT